MGIRNLFWGLFIAGAPFMGLKAQDQSPGPHSKLLDAQSKQCTVAISVPVNKLAAYKKVYGVERKALKPKEEELLRKELTPVLQEYYLANPPCAESQIYLVFEKWNKNFTKIKDKLTVTLEDAFKYYGYRFGDVPFDPEITEIKDLSNPRA